MNEKIAQFSKKTSSTRKIINLFKKNGKLACAARCTKSYGLTKVIDAILEIYSF